MLPALPHRAIRALSLACLAAAACVAPSGAAASERVDTFDLPSAKGHVDIKQVAFNKVNSLKATVILPDGYSANPDKAWPVVYMLAGIGDNHSGWMTSGQIDKVGKDWPAIIVLPETAKGFMVDWWKGNERKGLNWTRYLLEEVVPTIHQRYRVLPGRENHAIAGISMGGYGALLLAGQLPSYFGTAVSMSGLVDSQSPEAYLVLPIDMRAGSYDRVWGPVWGPYATVTNPLKTVSNVAHTRLYVHTGRASIDPKMGFNPRAWTEGLIIESFAHAENRRYRSALNRAGVAHTFVSRTGIHDWPYWVKEVPRVAEWGLFKAPPYADDAAATKWKYQTMAGNGNAWGLGYTFAKLPSRIATFERNGATLKISGSGTVTVNPGAADWDASGTGTKPECSFTVTLPAERTLPAGCA